MSAANNHQPCGQPGACPYAALGGAVLLPLGLFLALVHRPVLQRLEDGEERLEQYRWNNPGNEGFHQTPGMWGNMTIGPGLSAR